MKGIHRDLVIAALDAADGATSLGTKEIRALIAAGNAVLTEFQEDVPEDVEMRAILLRGVYALENMLGIPHAMKATKP